MQELSLFSRLFLYILLVIMGFICLIVWFWQFRILKGKAMKNPDGSYDSWHEQKTHYGIAFADVFIACPLNIVGIILVFTSPRWGYYMLALVSFWWVWANTMTTSTSLRFWKPKINLVWVIIYPFGIFVGLMYILWSIFHFDLIYSL
jgi:hypothetical protein